MQKLISVFTFLFLYTTLALGQAAIHIPFSASDGSLTIDLAVGLDLTATNGIDPALGESDLPPFPPAGNFEIRFDLTAYAGDNLSSAWDFRAPGAPPAFPFTGSVEHTLWWQRSAAGLPIDIQYDLPDGAAMRIIDQFSGALGLNIGPLTGTGTAVIPGSFILTNAYLYIDYTNIEPEVGGPVFSIDPSSLNFGNVLFPGNSMLQATVTNTGTDPLEITGIVSSLPEFTFSPSSFPINIAAAGNQVFDVTFTPSAIASFNGTLTFSHNAGSGTTVYNVSGNGASSAPVFSVNPASLNFGNVEVGLFADLDVTVSNTGPQDALVISLAAGDPDVYTVSPENANIPSGGNQVFTVTFTPAVAGSVPGTLTFTHNAAGSPDVVNLSGNGVATKGLILEDEELFKQENVDTTVTIQLFATDAAITALQFKLEVNMGDGDDQVLLFNNIQKGTDVADAEWLLDYQIFRGPSTPTGMLRDYALVVLYNLSGSGLPAAGNYEDLLKVNFTTRDLPPGTDFAVSTIQIKNAQASTTTGDPVNITPSAGREKTTITVFNSVQTSWGDVNGDGYIDILDVLLVVDHIVGRDSLTGDSFLRADIAPWGSEYEPEGDGFVNVQDLSLIQNIILTGQYPNGVVISKPSFFAGAENSVSLNKGNGLEATVQLYITKNGITAHLISDIGIRGAQFEFSSVGSSSAGMSISTRLGGGYHNQVEDILRVLLYDAAGNISIEAGTNFLASLPFKLENPHSLRVDKIILVTINNEKIGTIKLEIIYSEAPEIPYDFTLFQNYPNPFNPNTVVQFRVPETSNVTITIYDMLGREVRTLVAGQVEMGTYRVNWDGLNNTGQQVSSGSYIYKMTAGEFVQSKKMVLLK